MVKVTWRPFRGWFATHGLVLPMITLSTKCEVYISTHYENMTGETKYRKLGSLRSLKVTRSSNIRCSAYEFLLAFCNNYVPIWHRFWDIAKHWSKIAAFNSPHLYRAIVRRCLCDPTFSRFGRVSACDRRTDGQTTTAYTVLA